MKRERVYFVSGTGTDVGKSYATGWLAAQWNAAGSRVITQKLIQTGCTESEISEDIITHRRLMGAILMNADPINAGPTSVNMTNTVVTSANLTNMGLTCTDPMSTGPTSTGLLPEDLDNTTCPLRLAYPASPDLAARIEGRKLDLTLVDNATAWLSDRYDTVLIEGAGGLLVPIEDFYTMADYAAERALPIIIVSGAYLGSVNHTLLTLEACRTRGLRVAILAYNLYGATSPEITADTREYLKKYLAAHHPGCEFVEIPVL